MRNANRERKRAVVLSALTAAGLAAWAGAPCARGAITVSVYDYGSAVPVGSTQAYTTYVFAAQATGADGTALEATEVVLDAGTANPGVFGVDIESNGKTGATARYTANVDGSVAPTNGISESENVTDQSIYGDPEAGTFGGIGYNYNAGYGVAAPFVPGDIGDNPFVTLGAGNIFKTYTNLQTQDYTPTNQTTANYATASLANLDAAFQSGGNFNAGQINNGSLFSLQLLMADLSNSVGNPIPQPTEAGGDPFLQVVVQTGVPFTLYAQLAGYRGANGPESYSTVINGDALTVIQENPDYVVPPNAIVVPETSSAGVLAMGAVGLMRRRRGRKA